LFLNLPTRPPACLPPAVCSDSSAEVERILKAEKNYYYVLKVGCCLQGAGVGVLVLSWQEGFQLHLLSSCPPRRPAADAPLGPAPRCLQVKKDTPPDELKANYKKVRGSWGEGGLDTR